MSLLNWLGPGLEASAAAAHVERVEGLFFCSGERIETSGLMIKRDYALLLF